MHELEPKEAPFQAPLAPPCLHCQRFMPPVMSIYASQDIREIPREKVVAYVRALQHFARQNNLPKRNKWHLLAESVLELRKEVKFYLSFTDEEVLRGVPLPEEEEDSPMVSATADVTTTVNIPSATDAPEAQPVLKAMLEEKAPKFARWEKIIHPSQPVLATREIPQPSTIPKVRGIVQQLTQMIPINLPLCVSKAPLPLPSPPPARALALRQPPTLPQGFARITACLKTPEVMEVGWGMPVGTMSMGLVTTPGISSVSSSCMVKDDTTGLVYVNTITPSIGRVILGRLDLNEGLIIEDITDQS